MDHPLPEKSPSQSPTPRRVQGPVRRGYWPQALKLMSCAIVIIVVSIAGMTIARDFFKELVDFIHCEIFGDCGPPGVELSEPTIEEIKKLGRLDTLEADFSTVVKVINRRGTPPFESDEVLIYGVCGRAVAGIDLSKLGDQDVITSGSTITVSLPQVEVSVGLVLTSTVPETGEYPIEEEDRKVKISPACGHVYRWTVPWGMDPTPELIRDAEEQAEIQFKAIAEEGYVLELAQRNAEKELERFFKLTGYKDVRFVEPPEPVGEPEGGFEQLGRFLQRLGELQLPEPEE